MAIAIGVLAVSSVVGEEGCTAFELRVSGVDTGVNYIGACAGTSGVVVGVGRSSPVDVGDTAETPGGGALSDISLLLQVFDLKVLDGDNGVLLNVLNLGGN